MDSNQLLTLLKARKVFDGKRWTAFNADGSAIPDPVILTGVIGTILRHESIDRLVQFYELLIARKVFNNGVWESFTQNGVLLRDPWSIIHKGTYGAILDNGTVPLRLRKPRKPIPARMPRHLIGGTHFRY